MWYNLTLADVILTTRSLTGILGSGEGVIEMETVNGNTSITGF
jgi:hypothetical protein